VRGADKAAITGAAVRRLHRPGRARGQKSLAIEVTLQPGEKSFTDEELKAISDRIVARPRSSARRCDEVTRAAAVREASSRAGALVRPARLAVHRRSAQSGRQARPRHAIGRRVLDWPGDPRVGDALALRLCGGLHALVRTGQAPRLRALSAAALPGERLGEAVALTLVEQAGRSTLARQRAADQRGRPLGRADERAARRRRPVRLPHALFELGASAGLNLSSTVWLTISADSHGEAGGAVLLKPDWTGAAAARRCASPARGRRPQSGRSACGRERLLAYVWPDQERGSPARRRRSTSPRRIRHRSTAGDAADWLEAMLAWSRGGRLPRGDASVAFQYFPPTRSSGSRRGSRPAPREAGAPLAWLRLEKLAGDAQFSLRLRLAGRGRLLAWSHPHGNWIEWLCIYWVDESIALHLFARSMPSSQRRSRARPDGRRRRSARAGSRRSPSRSRPRSCSVSRSRRTRFRQRLAKDGRRRPSEGRIIFIAFASGIAFRRASAPGSGSAGAVRQG
jgi:hypothetical protein